MRMIEVPCDFLHGNSIYLSIYRFNSFNFLDSLFYHLSLSSIISKSSGNIQCPHKPDYFKFLMFGQYWYVHILEPINLEQSLEKVEMWGRIWTIQTRPYVKIEDNISKNPGSTKKNPFSRIQVKKIHLKQVRKQQREKSTTITTKNKGNNRYNLCRIKASMWYNCFCPKKIRAEIQNLHGKWH